MGSTADLELALKFVTARIRQEASESGQPLEAEQLFLLENLPSNNADGPVWFSEFGLSSLVPRNVNLERLCALAKSAYHKDREQRPQSLDWQFAFLIFTLNRHPMWGLLNFAGLKNRKPVADRLFLILASILLLMVPILLAWSEAWNISGILGIASGIAGIWVFLASQGIQKRQLKSDIEKYRVASSVADLSGTLTPNSQSHRR